MSLSRLTITLSVTILLALSYVNAQDRLALDSLKLSWESAEYKLDKVVAFDSVTDYKYGESADVDGLSLAGAFMLPWDRLLTLQVTHSTASVSSTAYQYDSRTNYLYTANAADVTIDFEGILLAAKYDFSSHILGELLGSDLILAPSFNLGYRQFTTDTELVSGATTVYGSDVNNNILLGGEAMLGLWWDSIGVGCRAELNLILTDGFGYQFKGTGFALWQLLQNHALFGEVGYLGEFYDDSVLGEEISSVYWRVGYRLTF